MSEVKERPILFSGAMVRAILAGKKTQTRRVIKQQPESPATVLNMEGIRPAWCIWPSPHKNDDGSRDDHGCKCPFGAIGDRLWVRETWLVDLVGSLAQFPREELLDNLYYRADGSFCEQIPECACAEVGKPKWKPSIHMPRWASRIELEITGVRVERVQSISSADCIAEGLEPTLRNEPPAKQRFRELWDSINADRGVGWQVNPWVWVIEFRRLDQ